MALNANDNHDKRAYSIAMTMSYISSIRFHMNKKRVPTTESKSDTARSISCQYKC